MELKQYIECVKKLEIEKYTVEKTIQHMDRRISKLGIPCRIFKLDNKPAEEPFVDLLSGLITGILGPLFLILGIYAFSLEVVSGGFVLFC